MTRRAPHVVGTVVALIAIGCAGVVALWLLHAVLSELAR